MTTTEKNRLLAESKIWLKIVIFTFAVIFVMAFGKDSLQVLFWALKSIL